MRTVTPPRSMTSSPRKPDPWCVLDASSTPAVLRCKNCGTTQPVQFPVPLTPFAKECDDFLREHRLCGLSLARLREMERSTQEVLNNTPPSRKVYDTHRAELYRIQATIRRLEPNPNNRPR